MVENSLPKGCSSAGNTITEICVDNTQTYQDILGFGAAFTDGACYMVSQLKDSTRKELMTRLFSNKEDRFNVCRTTVAQSDYGRECYSYNDTAEDLEMKNFTIDYDREYIIPVIKEARALNPDLFLFSSTWSPPGWMKTGGSMYGGWLRQRYLEAYANYYIKYLEAYEAEGIKIDALTPQNEVETDQLGKMPASYLHPDFESSFIQDYLMPMLEKKGMDTKVWILDHNYIMWKRAKWMLDNPDFKKYVSGVAFHPYEGEADMMSRLHEAHPDTAIYWTEAGTHIGENYGTNWCYWARRYIDALLNWASCITVWNLALDEKGNPNLGPFKCGGTVTIDSVTKEISYSGQYWALCHFSRFIDRGAVRIGAHCDNAAIKQIAFLNPDGKYVLVLANEKAETEVRIVCEGKTVEIGLPADSVSTIVID
jgi:glucosylceramidase